MSLLPRQNWPRWPRRLSYGAVQDSTQRVGVRSAQIGAELNQQWVGLMWVGFTLIGRGALATAVDAYCYAAALRRGAGPGVEGASMGWGVTRSFAAAGLPMKVAGAGRHAGVAREQVKVR